MGHVRLGKLRTSRKWRQVLALLDRHADVAEIADAVATAAEGELLSARGDPVLASTVWLLTQLPLAARSDRFAAELVSLGFAPGSEQSLLAVVAGLSRAVDSQISDANARTDFGELARQAAAESLSALVGAQLLGLFGNSAADFQIELAKFASKDRFARLARDFFSRLTFKTLDYYISRVLPDFIGPGRPLQSLGEQDAFRAGLAQHCSEAAVIVEAFAGGWFSKAIFSGRLTRAATQAFSDYALKKMRDELSVRRADDA
jgi:hypothetical protein